MTTEIYEDVDPKRMSITSSGGNVVHFHDGTGDYLRATTSDRIWNALHKMAWLPEMWLTLTVTRTARGKLRITAVRFQMDALVK